MKLFFTILDFDCCTSWARLLEFSPIKMTCVRATEKNTCRDTIHKWVLIKVLMLSLCLCQNATHQLFFSISRRSRHND
jgi:hypothetical protein